MYKIKLYYNFNPKILTNIYVSYNLFVKKFKRQKNSYR